MTPFMEYAHAQMEPKFTPDQLIKALDVVNSAIPCLRRQGWEVKVTTETVDSFPDPSVVLMLSITRTVGCDL